MSYEDLPRDLRSIPLTDTTIQADVVDLILGIEERRDGALALMVCDEADRGVQPVVLSDMPVEAPAADARSLLDLLLPMVGETGGAILVARGRRRGVTPTDHDRGWHQETIEACARHGVRLLGFYLASPDGIEAMPEPITQAS